MPLKTRYNSDFSGDVTYGNTVLNDVIKLAVEEISGVASLQGKGIKTDINGSIVNVDVFINVTLGVRCNDVAFRVQENIKRSVDTMDKYKIGVVNVNIIGVTIKEPNSNYPSVK